MKKIILDTNFYVAFKLGDQKAVETIRRAELLAVNAVVVGELLAGFRCGNRERQNRDELEAFLDSPRLEFLPVEEETAEFYAQIFAELRLRGRPIPTNDLWIAASAMQHGLALATYDEHFSSISGLLLVEKMER
jgi:tRNA(fMet)-specific endonuclease VapC